MKKQIFIYFGILIIFISIAFGLEECKGSLTTEEIPCYILLPYSGDCNDIYVTFYENTSFIQSRPMANYTGFLCNQTFNYSIPNVYTFNYSTGDSGSIILQEGVLLSFFNLLIYVVFMLITLGLIVFMHIFKEDRDSSIVYGWMATGLGMILGAVVVSPNFDVIKGISFIFPIDWYLGILSFLLAFYTGYISFSLYKQAHKKEDAFYY